MLSQSFFFIKVNRKFERINHSELIYIESCRGYVKLFTDQKTWMVHCTMQNLEQVLPANKFVRIHRGYIVALERISNFDTESVKIGEIHGKDIILPIGQDRYKSALTGKVTTIGGDGLLKSLGLSVN